MSVHGDNDLCIEYCTFDEMFAGCRGITSLTLPAAMTTIDFEAFRGECKGGMGWG